MATEPERPFAAYGARLRAARKAKGFNQTLVAKAIGVGQTTYSDWERGLSTPPLALAVEVARLLNVRITDLIGDSPEEEP